MAGLTLTPRGPGVFDDWRRLMARDCLLCRKMGSGNLEKQGHGRGHHACAWHAGLTGVAACQPFSQVNACSHKRL